MQTTFSPKTADPMHLQIERHLQRQILTGVLAPAQRLPPTRELAAQWDVNYTTAQRALQRLSVSGLIERKPKRGTFVRATTAKVLIGLIVGPDLLEPDPYFSRALVKALKTELKSLRWVARVYDNLGGRMDEDKEEVQRQLLWDIRNHTFKGLIWLSAPCSRFQDEVLQTDLPKVLVGADVARVDGRAFARAAVEYLAARGRRRLFFLRTSEFRRAIPEDVRAFFASCADHGLKAGRHAVGHVWTFGQTPVSGAEWLGYQRMRALLAAWERAGKLPDGLIVEDDVMMRGVAVALRERGIRVPEQMLVVSAANEGVHHLYAVPVIHYEFPISAMAKQAVQQLWRLAAGEALEKALPALAGRIIEDEAATPAAAGKPGLTEA